MRYLIFPILIVLSACSTCYIPNGDYESFGGGESMTKLILDSDVYTLKYEHWQPARYESRSQESEKGKWSCVGSSAEIKTRSGTAKAEFQEIGPNPLGLPENTKALVFGSSGNDVLSRAILYPSASIE